MYELLETTQFKKDLKKVAKRNTKDIDRVFSVLNILSHKGVVGIPENMRPHKLSGEFEDCWECHIRGNLLIIWIQFESPGIIKLVRLGSHSDLF